jgi:Family of unknown function (DUF5681)
MTNKRKKKTGAIARPKDTRFRAGISGNPKGRPKGSKNIKTLILEAARKSVSITIDGKRRKISAAQATILQLALRAARGDQKATVEFLDRVDQIETEAAAAKPAQISLGDADVEVLQAAYERLKKCEPEQASD